MGKDLSEWLQDSLQKRKARALKLLAILPRVEHGVALPPPLVLGNKQTYHAGHGGKHAHLNRRIADAPIQDVPLVGLHTIQTSVKPERVAQYIEDPDIIPPGTKGEHGGPIDLPIVVRQNGGVWVHDGHHRICARVLQGYPTVRARFVDLDAAPAELPAA